MDLKDIEQTRFTLTNDPADSNYRLITLRLPLAALGDHTETVDITGADAMARIARFAVSHAASALVSIGHAVLGRDLQAMVQDVEARIGMRPAPAVHPPAAAPVPEQAADATPKAPQP